MNLVRCHNCNKEFDNEIEGITLGNINGIGIVVKYYCSKECKEEKE